ncbi:acyl-CoA dehydrogenase family protein [Phaeacidiphilus oryzae]|uniref:acyl-CoA dehydrogenase family protein n=1 Tax=Phaeacidiphilus oryzae TaxID=348818 RepID=UPI00055A1A1C|nr:acyl-CoA dehydrogenase family protein [Phaeacidiphilus oryzae]
MRRTVFNEDHEAYRQTVRDFLAKEVVPVFPEWEQQGYVPKEIYRKLGELGVWGIEVPEEYGGAGIQDYRYHVVLTEECARANVSLGGSSVHVGLVLPYLMAYATEEQKQRWLPPFVSGEMMTAIAMTEPGTGSDLAGMSTTAKLSADGTHYVLNGAKTFITGGVQADRVLVIARTSPYDPEDRRAGLSILAVDTTSEGYAVGRKLEKIGLRVSDTAELSFTDVKVPVEDLLGEEGKAFYYLGQNLVQERLGIAVNAVAVTRAAIDLAVEYTQNRKVFGKAVSTFQNTKFELAACEAEAVAAQALVDECLESFEKGELTASDVAKAKLFTTEVCSRVVDRCLQLHGGYGYMLEYPIARLYTDNRVYRIYGGTSEIMKSVIAKSMGL